MKIDRIGHDEPAIIVLGAGASRGASFVRDLKGVLPPLDTDFFTQAQRLSKGKPSKLIEDVVGATVKLFGENFQLTMEGFFTHIEHLSHVHEDYKLQGRPAKDIYRELRMNFLQLLAAVLDEAIDKRNCKYHCCLVKALSARDVILSFNYDWLIDLTLKKHAQGKWNPIKGYGLSVYKKSCQFWACEKNRRSDPSDSLKLLKLHGSMNWFPVPLDKKRPRLKLRQRWWHQRGKLKFEIAPPEWNKPIRSGIYKDLWRTARKDLRNSTTLVFIGYSLPETDLPARALFMVDSGPTKTAKAKTLKLLVVANPDRAARWRIRNVLSGRIGPETRILSFDSFAEFAKFLAAPTIRSFCTGLG